MRKLRTARKSGFAANSHKSVKRVKKNQRKTSVFTNEILNSPLVEPSRRKKNHISSYLLAREELSWSSPELSVFLLLALDFPIVEKRKVLVGGL